VGIALRAAALDPHSNLAARSVMRSQALSGDPAAALEHYRSFAERLADEIGGQPEDETAALAERVRKQRLVRPAAGSTEPGAADRLALVGREAELQRLLDALAEARGTPRASALIVEGDSGMGKTRLLEELLARARLDGAAVASVRAVEADAVEAWSGVLTLARGGLLGAPGLAG